MTDKKKIRKGLAAMSLEKRRNIAALGGKATKVKRDELAEKARLYDELIKKQRQEQGEEE